MPKGIAKNPQEKSRKISNTLQGHIVSDETKRKLSKALKEQWREGKRKSGRIGKNWSEEHKKRLSIIHKRIGTGKGQHPSDETKKKLSESHKGYIMPEEQKRKIGEANKGKYRSKETIKKVSEAKKGEKNPNWQGGKSFEPYTMDWTETLKRSIRERDNYICQLCSQYGNVIHHKNYDKKNCNPNNLITLCVSCNIKVNYNRDYWINYFEEINGEL